MRLRPPLRAIRQRAGSIVGERKEAKAKSEPKTLHIHFANITSWGRTAKAFLKTAAVGDQGYGVFGALETHVKCDAIHEQCDSLSKLGWKSRWCPSVATASEKGSAGGAMLAVRKDLKAASLHAAVEGTPRLEIVEQEALDWTSAIFVLGPPPLCWWRFFFGLQHGDSG